MTTTTSRKTTTASPRVLKAAGLWGRTALVTAVVGAVLPLAPSTASAEQAGGIAEIVMPIGPDGATYRAPQGEDDGEWQGPSALAISPDGVVWITDVYADRVLRYAPDGTRMAPIDVAALGVESAIDVAVDGDDLFVLDVYPRTQRYRVWRLTHHGQVQGYYDLPAGYHLEDSLSGIAMNGDGSLLVELRGGAQLAQVFDAAGKHGMVERDGFRVHGRDYVIEYSDTLFGPVTVSAGGVEVEIDPDHDNGGVRFLGATADGDFFVEVDEVMMTDGSIRVDATIRRYSAAGRLLSQARRDLWPTSFTYVAGPFALHGDEVYELQTREDHVAVSGKEFSPLLEPELPEVPARRLTAVDPVDAALVLSREAFPTGAQTALLGRDDDFADGLTTGGTQGRLGAPLLLTPGDRLDGDVLAELERLGVRTVHLLGGPAALSSAVEDALEARGMTTNRLAGRDRVETSVAVAQAAFPQAPVALLVRGFAAAEPTQGFADALAVGAWAAEQRWPTLLTRTDRLPAPVADHLRAAGTRQVYVVGGTAAVSDGVVRDLRNLGIAVTRVAGADRAGTALAIAKHRGAAAVDDTVGLLLLDGSGPDAWAPGVASAAYAAREGLQVVLAAPDGLPGATARWLEAASSTKPMVCGPFTARSTCDAAMTAVGYP